MEATMHDERPSAVLAQLRLCMARTGTAEKGRSTMPGKGEKKEESTLSPTRAGD